NSQHLLTVGKDGGPILDSMTASAMTREQALRVAERRKAARRARTSRIRRTIAVIAVCAFTGPFGFIYTQMAAGRDPALTTTNKTTVAKSTVTGSTTSSSANTGSRTSNSDSGS